MFGLRGLQELAGPYRSLQGLHGVNPKNRMQKLGFPDPRKMEKILSPAPHVQGLLPP